jgi:L-threonylcarbamoyladenylate synthase
MKKQIMTRVYSIDDRQIIIDELTNGTVGIIPTDTVYGLVALASNPSAVDMIYQIKQREYSKPPVILISNIKQLDILGIELTPYIQSIINQYWSGPNSLILPIVESKQAEMAYLHRGHNSLAVRLGNSELVNSLCDVVGPIASSSANTSGQEVITNIDDIVLNVSWVVDGGIMPNKSSNIFLIESDSITQIR